MVYDPSKADDPPYWVRRNITSDEETDVPAGFVIRVIEAWIQFI